MLDQDEWLQLCSDIQDVIDMYLVTINLTNADKDKVNAKLRDEYPHYMCWTITKKVKLHVHSDYLFDADCITIAADRSDDGEFLINIDEQNADVYLYDYPELWNMKHKVSNPDAPPGAKLYTFRTKDVNMLVIFIAMLDKCISV